MDICFCLLQFHCLCQAHRGDLCEIVFHWRQPSSHQTTVPESVHGKFLGCSCSLGPFVHWSLSSTLHHFALTANDLHLKQGQPMVTNVGKTSHFYRFLMIFWYSCSSWISVHLRSARTFRTSDFAANLRPLWWNFRVTGGFENISNKKWKTKYDLITCNSYHVLPNKTDKFEKYIYTWWACEVKGMERDDFLAQVTSHWVLNSWLGCAAALGVVPIASSVPSDFRSRWLSGGCFWEE